MTDIVARLKEPSWSHDCWGRSEAYAPPDIQLEAAKEILRLRAELKKIALGKLTEEEQIALGLA